MASKIERPCYECEERMPPDCHAYCEKYLQSQEAKAEISKQRIAESNKRGIVVNYVLDRNKRKRKRKNLR